MVIDAVGPFVFGGEFVVCLLALPCLANNPSHMLAADVSERYTSLTPASASSTTKPSKFIVLIQHLQRNIDRIALSV
ncbi:hypothetical protein N431DRAFT_434407 [Stipitochalara longipes BDJ]|nr:hypothetical protein N431DRAFT_434407 [Stipitochalara longipes BDJ]